MSKNHLLNKLYKGKMRMAGKKCVAVIFGGQSPEHEVSRASAQSIISNIDKNRFDVAMIGITKEGRWLAYNGPVEKLGNGEWQKIAETGNDGKVQYNALPVVIDNNSFRCFINNLCGGERKIDVVIPVLHGCNGEDGTIQGFFELADIPYVGCGVVSSAIGMDKGIAKIVFEKEGIPQANYLVFNRKQLENDIVAIAGKIEESLGYPCFVKPCNAGSSVGVSKADSRDGLYKALELAAQYDRRILVEEYINGREVECSVLGNDEPEASIVGEIIPCNEFYDYEAKYSSKSTSEIRIPAELPEDTINRIRDYAVRAFKALDCSGLSRVDFFVHRETGRIYLNEINTFPGFTSISMYPKLWEATCIPYGQLIESLIDLALERYESKKREI